MVFYLLGIPFIFGDFNRLAADKVQESLHGDLRLKRLHVHPGKSYIHFTNLRWLEIFVKQVTMQTLQSLN